MSGHIASTRARELDTRAADGVSECTAPGTSVIITGVAMTRVVEDGAIRPGRLSEGVRIP